MAMHNPKGRVNYEPNSWGATGGPREIADLGYQSYPEPVAGPKVRVRSETFADHYSQARQFFISQTPIEQRHIANAITFELSKVETPAIRSRIVAHLMNIDTGLAAAVAKGLRPQGDAPAGHRPPADPAGPAPFGPAVDHQERPQDVRRPEGRGAGHRRGRRRRPRGPDQGPEGRRGDAQAHRARRWAA